MMCSLNIFVRRNVHGVSASALFKLEMFNCRWSIVARGPFGTVNDAGFEPCAINEPPHISKLSTFDSTVYAILFHVVALSLEL